MLSENLNYNAISCSEHHATSVGEYGHVYVWGLNTYWVDPNNSDSESEVNTNHLSYQLGFLDPDIDKITSPVFFQLKHPIYKVKAASVACGKNFTAVVAVEKPTTLDQDEDINENPELFDLETSDFMTKEPPLNSRVNAKDYHNAYLAYIVRLSICEYLKTHDLTFIHLFKSSIMKEKSFLNIMDLIVNCKISEALLKEFINYKKMRLPGQGISLKPLYELVMKCKQSKGILYVFGDKEKIPVINTRLQAVPIKNDTLGYYLIELPLGLVCAKVSCGNNFVVFLTSNGEVYSWGSKISNALGKNRLSSYNQIKLVPELYNNASMIKDIACGSKHCLALSTNGIIYTWGEGKFGQLGNGRLDNSSKPEPINISLQSIIAIKAGHNSSFCITEENDYYTWGDLSNSKFGYSALDISENPIPVSFDFEVYDLAIGLHQIVAISKFGFLFQYSHEEKDFVSLNRKNKYLEGVQFYQVSASSSNFFAISTKGSIYSWNVKGCRDLLGRTGDAKIPGEITDFSQQFCTRNLESESRDKESQEKSSKIVSVHCAFDNTILITNKGEALVCGSDKYNQMGIAFGDIEDSEETSEVNEFVLIPRLSMAFKISLVQVACGAYHILAIEKSGKVLAWGANSHGQLGLKTFSTSESYPEIIKLLGHEVAIQVAAGKNHSMVLISTGEVYAFGSAEHGKLGIGPLKPTVLCNVPKLITSLSNIEFIDCGDSHSLAINKDHNMLLWGYGWKGQLGRGSRDSFYEPMPLFSAVEWKSAACGATHTLGISIDDKVYHWGEIFLLGEEPELLVPTHVQGLKDVSIKKAFASYQHSAVLIEAGTTIYSWGKQEFARILMSKADISKNSITQICKTSMPFGEKIKSLSINQFHGAAVTEAGKVFTWGNASMGRLGDKNFVGKEKNYDGVPLNLSHLLQDISDDKRPEEFVSDLQQMLQYEPDEQNEKNMKEVDVQIIEKLKDCINRFIEIADQDSTQSNFFVKVEHKQLSRLQQEPFSCLYRDVQSIKPEIEERITGYASLVTTYQMHCCYLYRLMSIELQKEKKLKMLDLIYTDLEMDERLIYTGIYLSKMLLKKVLARPDLTFPEFLEDPDSEIYKHLLLKILFSSNSDMEQIREMAEKIIQSLSSVAHDDENAIDPDPLHTPKSATLNTITAYQINRNLVDKRMGKLMQIMGNFAGILQKSQATYNFSEIVRLLVKEFLDQCKEKFQINICSLDVDGINTSKIVHTVLNIVFEPLCKALECPYSNYISVETAVKNPECNFKSLANTVSAFFSGKTLGEINERWLNGINAFNISEANLKLKISIVKKILKEKVELEDLYLKAIFTHSLEPFDKIITVSGQSLITLHSITNKNIGKLRVGNPSYDALSVIMQVVNPLPALKTFAKHESINLSLFTRSLRQDQSIVRCPTCQMLVPRDLAPSNFKPVIKIYDPMPPNSSTAVFSHILATGPKKYKNQSRVEYIQAFSENYCSFLKDFRVNEMVNTLNYNIDTVNSAGFGIPIEAVDEEQKEILMRNREPSLKEIEKQCEIQIKRRKHHCLKQKKISKTLDSLLEVLIKKEQGSCIDQTTQKNVLFNVEYGASNLELEQYSDSVMFSIYMNKIREYTSKKEMSINLFENITEGMKDSLRGFMKRSLNDLTRKGIIKEYMLNPRFSPKNIVISFEIDKDDLVIITTNSPRKLNICGRDEFREEELLFYDKITSDEIANIREAIKQNADSEM